MNRESFLEKIQRHLPNLLRAGTRLTGTRSDAEDLAQETVIRALQKESELRSPDHLAGWLLAIQKSVHFKARSRMGPRLEVLQGGAGTPTTLVEPSADLREEVGTAEIDETLADALDALPVEWREALWLREVEELSYEEIAAAQQCPIGTVRSRLARAREAMSRSLTEEKKRGHL